MSSLNNIKMLMNDPNNQVRTVEQKNLNLKKINMSDTPSG